MTDIDTEELRRLTAEATPGPWHTVTTTVDLFVDTPERQVASLNREFYGQADAALIAAMRNALPAILDALDAKDREIGTLRTAVVALTSSWQDAHIGSAVRRGPWIDRNLFIAYARLGRGAALEASEADRG